MLSNSNENTCSLLIKPDNLFYLQSYVINKAVLKINNCGHYIFTYIFFFTEILRFYTKLGSQKLISIFNFLFLWTFVVYLSIHLLKYYGWQMPQVLNSHNLKNHIILIPVYKTDLYLRHIISLCDNTWRYNISFVWLKITIRMHFLNTLLYMSTEY